jgi:hypothetical protein
MIGDKSAVQDLIVNQGATFSRQIRLRDQENQTIDLIDSTFRGQIRRKKESPGIAASFTFALNTEKTAVTMTLTAAQTSSMVAGPTVQHPDSIYFYDVEWERPGGMITRIMEGKLLLNREVTR